MPRHDVHDRAPDGADLTPVLRADPIDVRVSIGALVHWADSPVFRRQLMQASDFPVDDLQGFLAVNQLSYRGAMRPTDLADALQTGRSNVSKIVGRLTRAGLVVRTPDPADDRGVLVALTPAGRAAGRRILDRLAERVRDSFAGWEEADVRAFQVLLARYVASVTPAGTASATARA